MLLQFHKTTITRAAASKEVVALNGAQSLDGTRRSMVQCRMTRYMCIYVTKLISIRTGTCNEFVITLHMRCTSYAFDTHKMHL